MLLRVIYSAGFADHLDLDLARILHRLFDLLGNVFCQPQRCKIVNRVRSDNDADFTPGLQRVTCLDTLK